MIAETLAVLFLIQIASLIARLIEHRRDVLHYVANSNSG